MSHRTGPTWEMVALRERAEAAEAEAAGLREELQSERDNLADEIEDHQRTCRRVAALETLIKTRSALPVAQNAGSAVGQRGDMNDQLGQPGIITRDDWLELLDEKIALRERAEAAEKRAAELTADIEYWKEERQAVIRGADLRDRMLMAKWEEESELLLRWCNKFREQAGFPPHMSVKDAIDRARAVPRDEVDQWVSRCHERDIETAEKRVEELTEYVDWLAEDQYDENGRLKVTTIENVVLGLRAVLEGRQP